MGCLNTSNTPQTLVEPSFAQGLVFSQHMYLMSQHNTGDSFFCSFSIEIFIHTKDDIKRVQQIMPKIGQLKGATEVHLLVFEDGNRKKDLPSDSAWRPIWIKEPDLDD